MVVPLHPLWAFMACYRVTFNFHHSQWQALCVECDNMARSRNHCCHGKAKTVTYSECLSVTLGIQHAERMRPLICLYGAAIFFPQLIIGTIVRGENVIYPKM